MNKTFITSKDVLIGMVFFALTVLFYRNTIYARFTYDFVISIANATHGINGMSINSEFLPVANFLGLFLYKVFGVSPYPCFIICSLWHSLNAYLLLVIVRKLLLPIEHHAAIVLSMLSAVMFLLSPYQTETVIWQAAIHYLALGSIWLGCVLLTMCYCKHKKIIVPVFIALLFSVGLFTHEAALVIPFVCLSIVWFAPSPMSVPEKKKVTAIVVLPLLVLTGLYFLIVKKFTGVYFSHHGGKPIEWITVTNVIGNCLKYAGKFIFFLPFWSLSVRDTVYDFVEMPSIDWLTFIIFAGALTLLFLSRRYFSKNGRLLFLFFVLMLLSFAPFSSMPYRPIFSICSERHSYLATMFFYPLLVLSAHHFLHRYKYFFLLVFFSISTYFLVRHIGFWTNAGRTHESLIKDFRWYDKANVFVLSSPNRFQGAWIFESFGSTLGDALMVHTGNDIRSRIHEVTQFNMLSPSDSVQVRVTNDSTVSVWDIVPGSWIWFRSLETDDYKMTRGDLNFDFVTKRKPPNSVYIYSVGGKWKEVSF